MNTRLLVSIGEFVDSIPSSEYSRVINSQLDSIAVRIADSTTDYRDSIRDWQNKERALRKPYLEEVLALRKLKLKAKEEDKEQIDLKEQEINEIANHEVSTFALEFSEWKEEEFKKDIDFTFLPEELEVLKELWEAKADYVKVGILQDRKAKNQVTEFLKSV